jgi:hypothetical protein
MDSLFFAGNVYAERIQRFSHELTTALDLSTIARMLREQISSTLSPPADASSPLTRSTTSMRHWMGTTGTRRRRSASAR